MPPIVTDQIDQIGALCQRYGVRKLYLFGSAVRDTFDPQTSDLDFMVDLGEYGPDVFDRYVGFYQDLVELFGREVDLLTERATGNEPFLREVRATRQMIYAA